MEMTYSGSAFEHRGIYWAGVLAVVTGVVLHLPMYYEGRNMGFRLVGMPVDLPMIAGMVLIVVGLAATVWGVIPRDHSHVLESDVHIRVRALDEVPINSAHVILMLVMAAAVTIDVMKPATLSFVLPGMTREYGLKSPLHPSGTIPVAYCCPLRNHRHRARILSLGVDGRSARVGVRRSSIAGNDFIATSICGSMPLYSLEPRDVLHHGTRRRRHAADHVHHHGRDHSGAAPRLAAGIDRRRLAGAYILTSWLAATLVPTLSWRILWLIGFPTGVFLILLNRWIPESPRFLLGTRETRRSRRDHEALSARSSCGSQTHRWISTRVRG